MESIISLIIPVYNGEGFIKECIYSILDQSYLNLQIIVVDDGSSDSTLSILRELEEKDPRIEVIHQKNAGVSSARNTGLSIARGDWILFVDADDIINPDYCKNMIESAQRLRVDVLIARDSEDKPDELYTIYETKKLILACLSYDELSFSFNVDAPWGKMFRTSIIRDNHICFPENLSRSEDALFCAHIYEKSKTIGVLNRLGYIHNEREGSLCRSFTPNAPKMLEMILTENKKWISQYHAHELDYQQALWYRILPGIVECEKLFFLHPNNPETGFKVAAAYQRFLNQPMIRQAIKHLKISNVVSRQYRIRVILYKLHLGWLFILVKGK